MKFHQEALLIILMFGFIWRADNTTKTFSESFGRALIRHDALSMPAFIKILSSLASPKIQFKLLSSLIF